MSSHMDGEPCVPTFSDTYVFNISCNSGKGMSYLCFPQSPYPLNSCIGWIILSSPMWPTWCRINWGGRYSSFSLGSWTISHIKHSCGQPTSFQRWWGEFRSQKYNNIKFNIMWPCSKQSASSNLLLRGLVSFSVLLVSPLFLAVPTWLFIFYSLFPSHAFQGSISTIHVACEQNTHLICCLTWIIFESKSVCP